MTIPQSPVEVLRAARKLIDHPEDWTKCHFALDSQGDAVRPNSGEAVCFCSYGAIMASTSSDALAGDSDDYLRKAIGYAQIDVWNDDPARTHAEVLAAFDRAIALAEQAGQ